MESDEVVVFLSIYMYWRNMELWKTNILALLNCFLVIVKCPFHKIKILLQICYCSSLFYSYDIVTPLCCSHAIATPCVAAMIWLPPVLQRSVWSLVGPCSPPPTTTRAWPATTCPPRASSASSAASTPPSSRSSGFTQWLIESLSSEYGSGSK